jgi:hypothetical protein
MPFSYSDIIERLEAIEVDLADRQGEYAEAAAQVKRLTRDYELRLAQTKQLVEGKTETETKDRALIAIAAADDSLYADLRDAEASLDGAKAAVRVLEVRATIGMSLKKDFAHDHSASSAPEPQWSGAAA